MNAPARRLRLMPEPATPPHGNRGAALAVEGLRKRYGASEVLRGIDLAAAPGTFVAVIGRSGCGKSTLLRLLAGLDEASGGRILLDGRPLAERRGDARIMFQDARLLPWRRVLDNVGLGLAGDWRPRACAALAEVGLADRAGDWPAILSGGQRQRVALARALVHKPRLMLLDEPLGALDALTRIAMHALIEEVWREEGFTAVLVTHDVAEAVALADRVVMLEHGRVALDLPIPLPRPRARGSAAFAALEDRILKHLLGDSGKQP